MQTLEEYAEFAASVMRRAMARVAAAGWPPPDGLPVVIVAISELLSGQDRAAIKDAFGVPPVDQFVSTEGLVGHTDPGGAVFAFATDLCIIELVDAGNRPVPEGAASAKVLVTNLHNRTQPLIRYELTDHFTRRPDGADPYLRATVEGRVDETFSYRDVTVDPLVIRTVMVRTANAVEYQVRQTSRGVDVAVVADGPIERADLESSLERSLRTAGLPDPRAQVREVAEIGRHPQSGKTRRFIPL